MAAVVPCLRYRDAHKAIAWLCDVFGFTRHLVVDGENGTVAHAELALDGAMIMLGSVRGGSAYGDMLVQPDEIGGRQTQTIYLVVADADAVHARALNAGAAIVIPLVDEDYGGRGFTCRDLEGHVWSVGTYDPWQADGSS
ncbi:MULTISPECIES: VOC family protein [unclassified Massilia]|uniref:VOC family protein n=1 Tax=unclassified Massilia TaxID=2609279 RepID=UPI00178716E1|nr:MULTISPECIES: VOC family protein [unclassified Massilia]MBD8529102.1 VOC family protein [Massilia sp. CFBP 13647]MBD8672496.1 VOC family protein [Massilia sp. CFBP 13721]